MKAFNQQQRGVDLSIFVREGALVLDKDATSCVDKLLNTWIDISPPGGSFIVVGAWANTAKCDVL